MKELKEQVIEILNTYGISDYKYRDDIADEITALINDNYVPKEFVAWYGDNYHNDSLKDINEHFSYWDMYIRDK